MAKQPGRRNEACKMVPADGMNPVYQASARGYPTAKALDQMNQSLLTRWPVASH
jgi:hypothetical protein